MDGSASPEDRLRDAGARVWRPGALPLLDPRFWTDPAPARQWIIPDFIPIGVVSGLYGDGGIGKTLLAQQLMTSVSLGVPWLGMDPMRCRTLGVFCEDDEDELHRRQEGINRDLGVDMGQLGDMRLLSRLGDDNALVQFDGTRGSLTAFHVALEEACREWWPGLVVLDTAADLYPDNENDRSKVRWFVQSALAKIARERKCAVLLLAHPSASGLASGAGTGGSTAWNNTLRSRLYLSKEEGEDADSNVRTLSRKKSNYSAQGGDLRLVWRGGVLAEVGSKAAQPSVQWDAICAMFDELDRAWKAGKPWSSSVQTRGAGRYFPTWAKSQLAVSEKQAAKLMIDWIVNGFLTNEMVNTRTKATGLKVLRRLDQ